ncbi:sugar transferase [Xylanimonas allomyrinae]|nr:sugar transferase [Xylanimonas allomyrinae]
MSGTSADYVVVSVCLGVLWFVALSIADTRDPRLMGTGMDEYALVVNVTLGFFGLIAVVSYLTKFELARGYVALALPAGCALLVVWRWAVRQTLVTERTQGRARTRALVVGGHGTVTHIVNELTRNAWAPYHVVGACVPDGDEDALAGRVPIVGTIADAARAAREANVEAVLVTGSDEITPAILKRLAWDLEPTGTDLLLASALTDVAGSRVHRRPAPGLSLQYVEAPRFAGAELALKRTFDIVVGMLLVVVTSVPLVVTAVAVKATSKGPVLFRQQRVGQDGRPFTMLKFRSMAADAEARLAEVLGGEVGVFYKPKHDPG